MKINGITIKNEDNTTQFYNSTDGKVEITLNITKLKIGEHTIEVVTRESNRYLTARNTTILTITSTLEKKTSNNTKTASLKKSNTSSVIIKDAIKDNIKETMANYKSNKERDHMKTGRKTRRFIAKA